MSKSRPKAKPSSSKPKVRPGKPRPPKGGPGSGRKPGGPVGGYSEQPASHNPGKPRSGISPSDLFPYGRNPDGTPKPKPRDKA